MIPQGFTLTRTTRLLFATLAICCHASHEPAASSVFPSDTNLNRSLFVAISAKNSPEVDSLLIRGANPNGRDHYGQTALCAAVNTGSLDIVNSLIRHRADLNKAGRAGTTPLGCASEQYRPNLDVLRLLLDSGAKVDVFSGYATPLMRAANRGAVDIVNLLLDRGAKVHLRDSEGSSALMYAVNTATSRFKVVESLIKAGADVNGANHAGNTPLMVASRESRDEEANAGDTPRMTATSKSESVAGKQSIFSLLLEHGGNVNARNHAGTTVLMRTVESGLKDNVIELLKRGADPLARDAKGKTTLLYLRDVSYFGDFTEIASELVRRGVGPEGREEEGLTPLMLAARAGSPTIVNVLLARGADVNARSKKGDTALLLANGDGYVPVITNLLAHGADLRAHNRAGMTILMAAARNSSLAAVNLLLDKGLEVNARDKDGRTAIYYALKSSGQWTGAILKTLLSRGALINDRDRFGWTPLMYDLTVGRSAMLGYDSSSLHMLISAGANVAATGKHGEAALILASENGRSEDVAASLLLSGADPNARDKDGNSALSWSARYDKAEWTKKLLANGALPDLFEAILLGDKESAIRLAKSEARFDRRGPFKQTPLMVAAAKAYPEIVRELLARGADPNLSDEYGMTPLHFAVSMSHLGLQNAREFEGDLDQPNEQADRFSIVSQLLMKGADINAHSSPKAHAFSFDVIISGVRETAIEWAVRWGYKDIVSLLLENGADVSGSVGKSTLYWAEFTKRQDLRTMLLNAGARD